MYNLKIVDNTYTVGPDGQTQDWIIAKFERYSDVQDVQYFLSKSFPKFSFYFYQDENSIPINPTLDKMYEEVKKSKRSSKAMRIEKKIMKNFGKVPSAEFVRKMK